MTSARISRVWGTILLTITIFSLSLPAYAQYSGGTGDPNDPYQIATAEDLMLLGETPEDYDKHFIMTADIDLDPNLPGRKVFDRAVIAPDVNDAKAEFQGTSFTGLFEGDGHIISNLTIEGESCLGLFGQLGYRASVCNLGLEAVDVSGSGNEVGGLVGLNGGSITSCYSNGKVTGNTVVGGLIGYNEYGHITDSHSDATVGGGDRVGGLVGEELMGNISSSYNTHKVSGDSMVGGLVGASEGGSIVWSYNTGSVSGTGSQVGGLVGDNYWGLITTSYNTGSVNESDLVGDLVGGLVGETDGACRIVASYSTGAVYGVSDVGGLVGIHSGRSRIISSYSNARVTGTDRVGGLVGCNSLQVPNDNEYIISSFWDTEASGQTTSAGGIDKTTAKMQDIQTFLDAGWDFETVWTMPSEDYARLERRRPNVPDSDGWIQLSSMKMARDQFAGAIVGDEIFVFGGNSMGGWDLFSGEKYNIATDTWSDIADNPHYEHSHDLWLGRGVEAVSGIEFNGKFYVFGADGGPNYNEVYDLDTNTWTTLAKKPTMTAAAVPVLYKGEIYLFGGYEGESSTYRNLTVVEAYDPDQDTWRYVTDMPKSPYSKAVAVHDHSAYIIGGYDEDVGGMNDEVMRYDLQNDTWERYYCKAPPDALGTHSYATQAPVINGKVYLIGGDQGDSENNGSVTTFAIFDIELKEWDFGPALPKPRSYHLAVIPNNTIYVIGGKDRRRHGEMEFDNTKDSVFALPLPGSP